MEPHNENFTASEQKQQQIIVCKGAEGELNLSEQVLNIMEKIYYE